MTVAELLSRISSRELTEWMAYWELEPFGPQMESWRAASVASVVANVNRGNNQKAYRVEDFMPRFDRKQSAEDMAAKFRGMVKRG